MRRERDKHIITLYYTYYCTVYAGYAEIYINLRTLLPRSECDVH